MYIQKLYAFGDYDIFTSAEAVFYLPKHDRMKCGGQVVRIRVRDIDRRHLKKAISRAIRTHIFGTVFPGMFYHPAPSPNVGLLRNDEFVQIEVDQIPGDEHIPVQAVVQHGRLSVVPDDAKIVAEFVEIFPEVDRQIPRQHGQDALSFVILQIRIQRGGAGKVVYENMVSAQ